MNQRKQRSGIVLLLGLVVALAACAPKDDGNRVATVGGAASPASSGTAGQGDAFKFAQCMRDNGIKNWPDPQPDTGGSRDGGPARVIAPEGADPKQIQQAQEKCKQYLPNGGDAPQRGAEDVEQMRKFAQCMRDNGLSNFPDPSAGGGNQPVPRDINPESPEFKAAFEKCKQYMSQPQTAGSR
ncbi:hypothetical protein [Allorhizocola rhizosphaerae]|uniref:hypothetical protein n=1 Tax=Allorhizocola rhizosphaerae TaxID=1872709 RepID=UPI000E3BFCF6|nr:hypothetical protein [Allorhizocola rhizosphaerae]